MVVGLGMFGVQNGAAASPERNKDDAQSALLDERFYVVEVIQQGEAEPASVEGATYILQAGRLPSGGIAKGDRLALVWGW